MNKGRTKDDIKCDHEIRSYTNMLSLLVFFKITVGRTGLFGVRQILSPCAGNVTFTTQLIATFHIIDGFLF